MVKLTMKNATKGQIGLVGGKFVPLHRGHQHLIETAAEGCYQLIVAVYDTPGFPVPVKVRADWVRTLYPQARVIEMADPLPELDDEDEISRIYADDIRAVVGEPIDVVFSSEEYGARWARHLGARHVLVDMARETVPVSGTLVRADPEKMRPFVHPMVWDSYMRWARGDHEAVAV